MKKTLLLTGAVLLILMAGSVLWKARKQPVEQQRIHLPDGSELTFLGASYGTNNSFHREIPPFRRMLSLLPDGFGFKQTPLLSMGFRTEILAVWFSRTNAGDQFIQIDARFADDLGQMGKWQALSTTTTSRDGEILGGFAVNNFPRRSGTVRMILAHADQGERTELGRFEFSNPAGKSRRWRAETLPVSKRDGDLELILKRIVSNVDWEDAALAAPDAENPATLFAFRFLEGGKPAVNWRIDSVSCLDETGNRFGPGNSKSLIHAGNYSIFRDFAFWPDTPVVKTSVKVSRIGQDEIISFTNVPVEPGMAAGQTGNWSEQGGFRSRAVRTGGEVFNLRIQAPDALENYRLSVRNCHGLEGESVELLGQSTSSSELQYMLRSTNDLSVLSFELVVGRSKVFEFVATAEILAPPSK